MRRVEFESGDRLIAVEERDGGVVIVSEPIIVGNDLTFTLDISTEDIDTLLLAIESVTRE